MTNVTIPVYNVQIDGEQIGLTAISFVDEPAILTDFVAFNKDNVENMIWFSSKEKREIVSPILIPNQLIYRLNKDGQPYYLRWTEEVIEQAAAKYLANGFWNNFTVMHPMMYDANLTYKDVLENDVYLLRMWIINDPKNDDAKTKYGFDLPKGTLMVHLKVHNRAIWNRIRSGELRGLSIECITTCVRDNNDVNLDINMSKLDVNVKQMNLFQKFIQFMNEVSAEAAEITDVAKKDETNSGEVSLKYYIDDEHYIEVDAEGFARDEEYNLVAEGEYKLADGNVLVVDGGNKFVETKAVSEEVIDEPIEAPIAESKVEDEKDKKEDDEEENKNDEGEGEGEDKPSTDEPNDESDDVDSEKSDEGTDDEDEKKRRVAAATVDEEDKKDEVPTEEVPTEEAPLALIPVEIDGVEYMLPQEVADYINSLKNGIDNVKEELVQMKSQIPSASPIPTVINQAVESEGDDIFSAIRALNRKK